MLSWLEALKVWNTGRMWCIPRKGTKEYDEVKAIMKGKKEKATKEDKVAFMPTKVRRDLKPKKN